MNEVLFINRRHALAVLAEVERTALHGRASQLWYSLTDGDTLATVLPIGFENFEGVENFKPEGAELLYNVPAYELGITKTGLNSPVDWDDPYYLHSKEYHEAEASYLNEAETRKVLTELLDEAEQRLKVRFMDVSDGLDIVYRSNGVIIINPHNHGENFINGYVVGYEGDALHVAEATQEGPALGSDPAYTYELNYKKGATILTGLRWNYTGGRWPFTQRGSFDLDGVLFCGPEDDGKFTAFTTDNNPPTLYVALLTEKDAAGQVVRSWILGAVDGSDLTEGSERYTG